MRRERWRIVIHVVVVIAVALALNVIFLLGTRNLWRKHQLKQLALQIQTAQSGGQEAVALYRLDFWLAEHNCHAATWFTNSETGEPIPRESITGSNEIPPLTVTMKFDNWYGRGTFFEFSFPLRDRTNLYLLTRGRTPNDYLGWP